MSDRDGPDGAARSAGVPPWRGCSFARVLRTIALRTRRPGRAAATSRARSDGTL